MLKLMKNKTEHFARSERATARNAIAFFLILTICLNIFSVISSASPAAGASAAVDVAWYVIRQALGGGAVGSMMGSFAQDLADSAVGAYENLQDTIDDYNNQRFSFAQLDNPVQYFEDGSNSGWRVNSEISMTAEQQEMATYMVNFLNTNCPQLVHEPGVGGGLSVSSYEMIVKQAGKSYLAYLKEKCVADQTEEKQLLADLLDSSEFQFSLTDHLSLIRASADTNTTSAISRNGYKYTAPLSLCSNGFYRVTAVESLGFTPSSSTAEMIDNGYCASAFYNSDTPVYSGNQYIVYNNQIYYYTAYAVSSTAYKRIFSFPLLFRYDGSFISDGLKSFYNASGQCLGDLGITKSQALTFKVGFCWAYEPVEFAYPTTIKSDDLSTTTTVGIDSDVGFSDGENTVSDALALGLISPGDILTIDENGDIVAADNIAIDKLQEILDAIKAGTIDFDDIKEYMQVITQLIGAGNLTADEQRRLLDNVDTNVEALAGDISAIRAFADSLAEAKTENLDFDTSSTTIIDKFPFSIPFDFYNLITILVENPKEPIFYFKVQTTMNVGGLNQEIDETIEIDLTRFKYNGYDIIRMITNATSIIFFVACLITGTKKLIWK